MTGIKSRRQIIIIVTSFFLFLILTSFYHHIDKFATGLLVVILTLFIPFSFITLIVYAIKGLVQVIRHRRHLTPKLYSSAIVAWLALLYLFLSPWWFDSETLESKIELRACYEGTQNQSVIKFREDKSFEIHATGIFFASFWTLGEWEKNGDTIFFKFDNQRDNLLSDTIVIRNDYLIPIAEFMQTDSVRKRREPLHYYIGYCKGEN